MATASGSAERVYEVDDYLGTLLNMSADGSRSYTAFGSTFVLPRERKFGDIAGVQRYVDGVLTLAAVVERWPEECSAGVKVVSRTRNTDAMYRQGRISIPDHKDGLSDKMRELIVLHELGHHFGGTGHGERYREAYTFLVEAVMGTELAFLMRMYHQTGVS